MAEVNEKKTEALSKDAQKAQDLLAKEELVSNIQLLTTLQSAEDQEIKDKLELCVERLEDREAGIRQNALEMIKTEVAGATSSMTSVPKPLKYMSPLYSKLVEIHSKAAESKFKVSTSPPHLIYILEPTLQPCLGHRHGGS